jgi:hypothetical protein
VFSVSALFLGWTKNEVDQGAKNKQLGNVLKRSGDCFWVIRNLRNLRGFGEIYGKKKRKKMGEGLKIGHFNEKNAMKIFGRIFF